MATHPNLTCSTHIHNISVQAHKPLQTIKALTATGWVNRRKHSWLSIRQSWDRLSSMPPTFFRALASSTSINKLQVMQNATLRTATGRTQGTNIQHLHDKALIYILPIHKHLQLHASQYKQKSRHTSHPLQNHTTYFNTPRLKNTIFKNGRYTTNIPTYPHTVTTTDTKTNMRHIHTSIVPRHLANKRQ